jgi:hypothetical protein
MFGNPVNLVPISAKPSDTTIEKYPESSPSFLAYKCVPKTLLIRIQDIKVRLPRKINTIEKQVILNMQLFLLERLSFYINPPS